MTSFEKCSNKLNEMELLPLTPFIYRKFTDREIRNIKWKESKTYIIHYEEGEYYMWERNYITGEMNSDVMQFELNTEFFEFISNFEKSTKDNVINFLLEDEREVLQLRSERRNNDWKEIEEYNKQNLINGFLSKLK